MIKRQHLDKRINGRTYLANCLDPPGACRGLMILFVTVVGVNVRSGSIATDVARVKIHRSPLRSESNGPPSKRNLSQRAITGSRLAICFVAVIRLPRGNLGAVVKP